MHAVCHKNDANKNLMFAGYGPFSQIRSHITSNVRAHGWLGWGLILAEFKGDFVFAPPNRQIKTPAKFSRYTVYKFAELRTIIYCTFRTLCRSCKSVAA